MRLCAVQKSILDVFIRQFNIIIHAFENVEEIETTPTHPFRVEDEWVTADNMKAGDDAVKVGKETWRSLLGNKEYSCSSNRLKMGWVND